MSNKIRNVRIKAIIPLLSPDMVMHKLPASPQVKEHILETREAISNIVHAKDKRLLVIVGPCSIHDKQAAIEYAKRLKKLADKLGDKLLIAMRVYFEKPRTNIGWQGLINDPYLDGSFEINEGFLLARKILLEINEIGLPVATEFVDTITPQYLSDLVSWAAIGARTVESQPHRMLASGLSMPVGFKNNTSGDVSAAVNAVLAAKHSHRFLSVTEQGLSAIVATEGNDTCHLILRGGKHGPNYDANSVKSASEALKKNALSHRVIIDCSHANSDKDYRKQVLVMESIWQQLKSDQDSILGLMLESNLVEGRQDLQPNKDLNYGQSITDACIGWDETERLLIETAKQIEGR